MSSSRICALPWFKPEDLGPRRPRCAGLRGEGAEGCSRSSRMGVYPVKAITFPKDCATPLSSQVGSGLSSENVTDSRGGSPSSNTVYNHFMFKEGSEVYVGGGNIGVRLWAYSSPF
ncbi:hypothetical protein CERSUDRAFT_120061 [Gelatoporia subvermispora B]|uniref:Uncharacterized protein n=1 Tax=Ceriporiopsis subvermispora (strain B) TaxID=914234 RepID=M2P781_CERS8|nr:hypothetical protein CERSUDRAFT_120061 [Gelatoporia subvermispora B]